MELGSAEGAVDGWDVLGYVAEGVGAIFVVLLTIVIVRAAADALLPGPERDALDRQREARKGRLKSAIVKDGKIRYRLYR